MTTEITCKFGVWAYILVCNHFLLNGIQCILLVCANLGCQIVVRITYSKFKFKKRKKLLHFRAVTSLSMVNSHDNEVDDDNDDTTHE